MSQTNNGGPAFPSDRFGELGMSLRDYFAGQALAGYLANLDSEINANVVARWSYEYADAMLAARQKEQE